MSSFNCLFCNQSASLYSKLPPNQFEGVTFHYYQCTKCKLIQIDPIPSPELLSKMYHSESYHEVELAEILPLDYVLPGLRFTYQKQITEIPNITQGPNLDFGCGDGHFIRSMAQHQIPFDGVEFNPETIEKLASLLPSSNFSTVADFLANPKTYRVIRMSNVLEHFTNPKKELGAIIDKLESGGYLVIEGPIEMNWSWTNWLKWGYLKLRKKLRSSYSTSHAPTHTIYSNRQNQLDFFRQFPLEITTFEVREGFWPFAEKWKDCKSIRSILIYFFCSLGKRTMLSKNYGNVFLLKAKKL
ncbi:MAG: hypothetical protein K0S23_2084 [Fluviicola sp.]|jgi:2-polyprenyl-3-methyl-5-hydroxy-6-metoxy-1,4-benzoquinol methylase|uniref:class I SAM-dependent methyltransferase n=1 Tax=Fluviicola sp. TaxID=1917219 RepID=UPI002624D5A9|nr:class I SAM-dependent methyltransferase [Fluviicola sp.]MDF3027777.1 hypothetical protein [Fluviicola sp.]